MEHRLRDDVTERVEATSVRHEATDGAAREKLSRHAAEDQLAESAMSIAARDQKVRVLLFGDPEQLFSADPFCTNNTLEPALMRCWAR